MALSGEAAAGRASEPAAAAAGIVLLTLASAQFLMTLDSSVMNVSIATVAKDVGTTVTGIQTAITFYTLVMASLMITGGKLGQILGRKRAFAIGCVIYGCGSLTTALAGNLTVLIVGWSVLEGTGAALIMPAVVALVASNFARDQRPRAYGLVASAGAIAVAAGPLIGGLFTTYASWRWAFAGEVLVVLGILGLTGRMADTPAEEGARLDLVGTVLSALGLGLVVYGILRSGTWGLVQPKAGAPAWLGLSPVIWLILAGGVVLRVFLWWEDHRLARGQAALLDPAMLRNRTLRGGLTSFFFQYFLQAGLFFAVPLFLSVALGLSAIATGVRLLPLSITLLLAAAGVPRVFPNASPRRVVQVGFVALFAGIVIMVALLDEGAGPEIVTWPMLLAGLGVGALASQLGAVTVSSVPDEHSGEVGGIQNTVTNLGASIGTALSGAVLISALTASFLAGVQNNPAVPKDLASQAQVELAGGVPFMSDQDLQAALDKAGVPPQAADAIVKENATARIDGLRASLSVLAVIALLALFFSRRIPTRQPSAAPTSEPLPGVRQSAGKAFLLTFVDACGIDLEDDRRWEQAWDRLAPQYLEQAAQAEAEQLRQQLAAARARADRADKEAEQLRQQLAAAEDLSRQQTLAAEAMAAHLEAAEARAREAHDQLTEATAAHAAELEQIRADPQALEREVVVVPNVPRYHHADCFLIRFMDRNEVTKMTAVAARQVGCSPCRACEPDKPRDTDQPSQDDHGGRHRAAAAPAAAAVPDVGPVPNLRAAAGHAPSIRTSRRATGTRAQAFARASVPLAG